MNYGIPPNTGGHITGVDILLNKRSSEINYHKDISNISSQIDIKYNYIDYIHLELVDGSNDNENIFELFDDNNYHLALAKKTHDFQIELNSNHYTYGLEYNKKDFNPYGYYLTPQTEESFVSFYGFQDKSFENLSIYLQNNFKNDVFFAMSHGVHRGVLKKGKIDKREIFLHKRLSPRNDPHRWKDCQSISEYLTYNPQCDECVCQDPEEKFYHKVLTHR